MNNWKLVVGVICGSLLVVVAMAIGISNLSAGDNKIVSKIEKDIVGGARLMTKKENPKVVVVEFSDLQCPACHEAELIAEEIRKIEGVEFVYRHFPLPMHDNSIVAAQAVEAATTLGKGFEMLEVVFDRQTEWSNLKGEALTLKMVEYAKQIGLSGEEYVKILASDAVKNGVETDSKLAQELKLEGTPTFIVDGKLVAAPLLLDVVNQAIKN